MIRGRLAALEYLASAVRSLVIPVKTAERWIRPVDLFEIVDGIEERVRSLNDFIARYMEAHPEILRSGNDPENEGVLEIELADVRKQLALVERLRFAGKCQGQMDFSAEAEELRRLRSGERKIKSLRASRQAEP